MNPDAIVTVELRPGPDGWMTRPVTFAEFWEKWTSARTSETSDPLTTADLAARGYRIGTTEDQLIVVALLRCKRSRAVTGAVLHLSGPGRDPLMLAELQQAAADRWVSWDSHHCTPRTGEPSPAWTRCR